MSKVIKQMQMDALKTTFNGVRDMVLMNIVGLNAIAENQVRLALRKKGIRLQMVKNSLARKVFGEFGLKIESAWAGSTTVAWGGTSIAGLSKEIEGAFKKYDKFAKVKSAVADGEEITFAEALKRPTREEALGQIVSLILGPGSLLASALNSPGGALAGCLKSIEEKGDAGAAAEAAPEAAPSA